MVYEGLAGYSPPTQLAVCQLRHRQGLSPSALCALAGPYTASALQIALPTRAVFSYYYTLLSLTITTTSRSTTATGTGAGTGTGTATRTRTRHNSIS